MKNYREQKLNERAETIGKKLIGEIDAQQRLIERGLWDNIHAKRKRGEKPAKKGDKDYPDEKSWKKTTKASK